MLVILKNPLLRSQPPYLRSLPSREMLFFVSERENEWKGHGRCVIKRSWSFEFPYQPDRTDRNSCCTGKKKNFLQACFGRDKGKGSIRLDIWSHKWQPMSRNKLFQPRSLADECRGNNANWMTSSFSQGYLFNFIKSVTFQRCTPLWVRIRMLLKLRGFG